MAAPSKALLLTDVHALLKRRYKLGARADRHSILEAVVFGICHEGTTREQANQALSRFKDEFFDWNEVRVSSLTEIEATLAGLPDPETRAHRIRRFLRQLFDATYGFDEKLEGLLKKPLKEAIKALRAYEAMQSDYVLATVVQKALGGHAIPVDGPILRGLVRLGIADEGANPATLRATLERAVPKNRGTEFADLMEELTHDTCVEGIPDCPRCELRKICPTGQERLAADKAAEKAAAKAARETAHRPKPVPSATVASPPKPKAAAKPAPAKKPATDVKKSTRGKPRTS